MVYNIPAYNPTVSYSQWNDFQEFFGSMVGGYWTPSLSSIKRIINFISHSHLISTHYWNILYIQYSKCNDTYETSWEYENEKYRRRATGYRTCNNTRRYNTLERSQSPSGCYSQKHSTFFISSRCSVPWHQPDRLRIWEGQFRISDRYRRTVTLKVLMLLQCQGG